MMLSDVIQKHPETAPVIAKYGLHCIGCHAAAIETLEQGCKAHGLDDEKIDALVEELNKIIAKEIED